jgi:hypothetical protein
MSLLERMKKHIQKGVKNGIYFVRGGVRKKAKRLTKEGKKMLRLYELHSQVQKEMTELGGRIYDLTSRNKVPLLDRKVNAIIRRIKTREDSIAQLEGTIKKTTRIPQSKTDRHKSPQTKSKKAR